MEDKKKTSWGQPRDWLLAIGGLIAVVGLLDLISGMWTPDAAASAGINNSTVALIILAIGVVVLIVSFFVKPKA